MSTIAAIALGGALGAVARYGVNAAGAHVMGHSFPWGTLTVNVFGSFLMGLLIAGFAHLWQPNETVKALLVTGFLGAFTTFSAFSLDVMTLWERGAMLATSGYIAASVILSIAALFGAIFLMRHFVS